MSPVTEIHRILYDEYLGFIEPLAVSVSIVPHFLSYSHNSEFLLFLIILFQFSIGIGADTEVLQIFVCYTLLLSWLKYS